MQYTDGGAGYQSAAAAGDHQKITWRRRSVCTLIHSSSGQARLAGLGQGHHEEYVARHGI